VVGYFWGFLIPHIHHKTCLTLMMDLYWVNPSVRGKGLPGVKLLREVEAEARRRGAQQMLQIWVKDNISGFLSNAGRPVVAPSEATPSQTAAGSLVWNTTSQVLTSGNGSGRVTFADTATAQTLTNKRISPRNQSVGVVTSPFTPDPTLYDNIFLNGISTALTINAPAAGASNGQRLLFRLLDNGTARALTWNAAYRPIGVTLPTTTTAGKVIYVGCIYNGGVAAWDVVAETEQA